MDLRNNLIGCIGKIVSYEQTHYLVTDVFKIPGIGVGVTLIRLKDNLIITRLVCGVITDQGSGNFRGFKIENPFGFGFLCSLILCTPPSSDTIKNLMDKTDRLPEIVKFIKGFCSSYIRYLYFNRDKHFNKLPVYKRVMRGLLESYLNPENCIIQDDKRV